MNKIILLLVMVVSCAFTVQAQSCYDSCTQAYNAAVAACDGADGCIQAAGYEAAACDYACGGTKTETQQVKQQSPTLSCLDQCYYAYEGDINTCDAPGNPVDPDCDREAETDYQSCQSSCGNHKIMKAIKKLDSACFQSCYNTYESDISSCTDSSCYYVAASEYQTCESSCGGKKIAPKKIVMKKDPTSCYQQCYTTYESAISSCSGGDAECYQNAATAYQSCESSCGDKHRVSIFKDKKKKFVPLKNRKACRKSCLKSYAEDLIECGGTCTESATAELAVCELKCKF